MVHQRRLSTGEAIKEPHPVSLKALRLSRPSISVQQTLPPSPAPSHGDGVDTSNYLSSSASLAYPSEQHTFFILSPLLTLPPTFCSAYVGETFNCTLCANNEINLFDATPKIISDIKIEAEMKIPSSGIPVPLKLAPPLPASPTISGDSSVAIETAVVTQVETELETSTDVALEPSKSLQKIVSFDLEEEGSHVLAVTVTYNETTSTSADIHKRTRTFRKLYRFLCKPCIIVRTKVGVLSQQPPRKWALEAQLENCGDEIITLENVFLKERDEYTGQGINWDTERDGMAQKPILGPGDIEQVAFIVEEILKVGGKGDMVREKSGTDIFGALSIGWRGAMGNRGFLNTRTLFTTG